MAKFKPQTDPLSEEEIQEQTRFRIEKLKALQAEGKDPYEELTYDVTNHSVEIMPQRTALTLYHVLLPIFLS